MALSIKVNGRRYEIDADPDTPLLWVLRDNLGLTGTKFGCGIAACGACTVHVDGTATRSCVEDAVVVVADGYWPAMKGAERLNPVWEPGPNAKISSDGLRAALEGGLAEAGATARNDGDVAAAMAGAEKRIEATYHVPFLAHATMEPMNATARVSKEGVEIWAPTQNQGRTRWSRRWLASNRSR
jgi:isoquinoline 1-oxidoreductase subunit beta